MIKKSVFREKDIRPENLIKESVKYHKSDLSKILLKQKVFKEINCPACSSKVSSIAFKKNGFIYNTCQVCRMNYINPRPTFKILMDFYSNSKYAKFWSEKIFPLTEKKRQKHISKPFADRVTKICKKYKSDFETIADVGAGYGTFCLEIKKKSLFKKIIAIEPSSEFAEICRKKNLFVIEKPIELIDLDNISVLTLFETLEHIYSPLDFLKKCHQISSQPFLKYILIDKWEKYGACFQKFLSENLLSSHLWIVAVKK